MNANEVGCQVFFNHSTGDQWCFSHDDHADKCCAQVFFSENTAN